MAFCSNCGTELRGAMKYCSKCGHRIEDEEYEVIKKLGAGPKDSKFEGRFNRISPEESESDEEQEPEKEEEKIQIPPGAKVKSKVPKSTSCIVCNTRTNDICFFCNYAVCGRHNVKMQIFADKSKFGNLIQSCPECANKKNGKQPTKDEASEIGFFFNIKPYHEWRILE